MWKWCPFQQPSHALPWHVAGKAQVPAPVHDPVQACGARPSAGGEGAAFFGSPCFGLWTPLMRAGAIATGYNNGQRPGQQVAKSEGARG